MSITIKDQIDLYMKKSKKLVSKFFEENENMQIINLHYHQDKDTWICTVIFSYKHRTYTKFGEGSTKADAATNASLNIKSVIESTLSKIPDTTYNIKTGMLNIILAQGRILVCSQKIGDQMLIPGIYSVSTLTPQKIRNDEIKAITTIYDIKSNNQWLSMLIYLGNALPYTEKNTYFVICEDEKDLQYKIFLETVLETVA